MAYVDYSAAFAYKDLLTYQKLNQLGANDVYLKALTDNVNQDVKTSASPTFAGLTLENSGLHVLDTNASHDLVITPGSDLSADRILTITTGDAARTLTLSGNPTLDDWFDQALKKASNPVFAGKGIRAGDTTGGEIKGTAALSINAVGSKTLSFIPSGTFNIAGATNRGAYLIEIDVIGYLAGIDETLFKRFHLYLGASATTAYDNSENVIYSYGDSRVAAITMGAPTVLENGIPSYTIANADDSAFTGYIVWRVIMTTSDITLQIS